MAMLRMPYNNAMRLGQGVNSFTQQLCMIDAVKKEEETPKPPVEGNESNSDKDDVKPTIGVGQIVSYSSRFVDKVSDITTALAIKCGSVNAAASGKYIDTDKFKESDLNFFIQVKVTNQEHMKTNYTVFQPLPIERSRFTDIYGDTFISGWEEGGEFNALISIRLHDKSSSKHIQGKIEASLGSGAVEGKGEGELNKALTDHTAETTITVNWCGGGQLKPTDALWTMDSMTQAAANFPDLVAMTPQRKYAILTKYTMLPSYLKLATQFSPLDYENAGIYASYLLEAYTDYKALWKSLQVLSEEFQAGFVNAELQEAILPEDVKSYLTTFEKEAKQAADDDEIQHKLEIQERIRAALVAKNEEHDDQDSKTTTASGGLDLNLVKQHDLAFPTLAALTERELSRNKPFRPSLPNYQIFPATILGIQDAQRLCRLEMVKIVNEVDQVTKDPSIALDATRKTTFVTAAVFKQLVPHKEIMRLYDGNLALLPKVFQDAIQVHSDKLTKYRISSPWYDIVEDVKPPEVLSAFIDLDILEEDDIAFAVGIHYKNKIIDSIITYYTSGRAFHHGSTEERRGTDNWNKFGKDLTKTIRFIMIEGHGQSPGANGVVDKIAMHTSDDKSYSYQDPQRLPGRARTTYMHPPSGLWDFRGWWGSVLNSGGFTHLGAIWGIIQPVPKVTVLPYDPKDLDAMPEILRKQLKEYADETPGIGRYYRFSKCISTKQTGSNNPNVFASYFDSMAWTNRGGHAYDYTFYWKNNVICGLMGRYRTGWGFVIPRDLSSKSTGTTISLESFHASINQVIFTLQTRKNASNTADETVLTNVQIKGGDQTVIWDAGPGLKATGLQTWEVTAPLPEAEKDWLFGGFYGVVGDNIEHIGVVWVARQSYRLNTGQHHT